MSTKEYGCFFCKGKSQDFYGNCNKCKNNIDIGNELCKLGFDGYKAENVIGRGFNGWTLKVNDDFQSFVMKIIPEHRTKKNSLQKKEIEALVQCAPHRNLAGFIRPVFPEITILNQKTKTICLVFDFIKNANSLGQVLLEKKYKFSRADVVGILNGIASGLQRMHSRNLWHDDLHDGNIMIRKVDADENLGVNGGLKMYRCGGVKVYHPD